MDIFFVIYMFCPYLLLPLMIPAWIYLFALILLTIVCACFWKRRVLRTVCIVISLLIVIPFWGLRAMCSLPSGKDSIFDAEDEWGGCTELWIPKEGSSVYLFKFTE